MDIITLLLALLARPCALVHTEIKANEIGWQLYTQKVLNWLMPMEHRKVVSEVILQIIIMGPEICFTNKHPSLILKNKVI